MALIITVFDSGVRAPGLKKPFRLPLPTCVASFFLSCVLSVCWFLFFSRHAPFSLTPDRPMNFCKQYGSFYRTCQKNWRLKSEPCEFVLTQSKRLSSALAKSFALAYLGANAEESYEKDREIGGIISHVRSTQFHDSLVTLQNFNIPSNDISASVIRCRVLT